MAKCSSDSARSSFSQEDGSACDTPQSDTTLHGTSASTLPVSQLQEEAKNLILKLCDHISKPSTQKYLLIRCTNARYRLHEECNAVFPGLANRIGSTAHTAPTF
eukprot:71585-Amphidinium_carterae.1